MIELGFLLFFAYIVGSIPTGYWFAKIFFNVDVMQHGSGNIGATNVARVLGSFKYFFLIFFIDAGKAAGVILGANYFLRQDVIQHKDLVLIAIACSIILGNSFSIFLSWKGGKSVASLTGIVAGLFPLWLLGVAFLTWGLLFFISRRQVFIASIGAAWITLFFYLGSSCRISSLGIFLFCAVVWLTLRHVNNIRQFCMQRR